MRFQCFVCLGVKGRLLLPFHWQTLLHVCAVIHLDVTFHVRRYRYVAQVCLENAVHCLVV